MTSPSHVLAEEILARCLTEPMFLDSLIADRDAALKVYSLDAETRVEFDKTDFRRIRQFSGFIGKVQHNYLWDFFPATRRLLRHYKLETNVFAEYRPIQLSPEVRNLNRREKIARFLVHLFDFITKHPEYPALATVARYERIAWELCHLVETKSSRGALTAADLAALRWTEFLRLAPKLTSSVRIEGFECDPAALVVSVLNGTFTHCSRGPYRFFVLCLDPDRKLLRTFEIDELPALLLSHVGGSRRLRAVIAIARRRLRAAAPPRAFRAFFEECARAGFIQFENER